MNKIIEDDLKGNAIPWTLSVTDQEDWSQDDGSLIRKTINPITALAMFGKASSRGITPMKAKNAKIQLTKRFLE